MGTADVASFDSSSQTKESVFGCKRSMELTNTKPIALIDLLTIGGRKASKATVNDKTVDIRNSNVCRSLSSQASTIVDEGEALVPDIRSLRRVRGGKYSELTCDRQTLGIEFPVRQNHSNNYSGGHASSRRHTGRCPHQSRNPTIGHGHSALESFLTPEVPQRTGEPNTETLTNSPHHETNFLTMRTTQHRQLGYGQYQTQPAQKPSHAQRPRSQAIAIKRSNRQEADQDAASSEESNQQMYDWATWRMYNRIVDHRLAHRIPAAATGAPVTTIDQHQAYVESLQAQEAMEQSLRAQPTDYGEVFELDI